MVTLGTRGFSGVGWEFSVLAEGRHIFGLKPKPPAAKRHYKDLTETGNRARKVSGTQGSARCPTTSNVLDFHPGGLRKRWTRFDTSTRSKTSLQSVIDTSVLLQGRICVRLQTSSSAGR